VHPASHKLVGRQPSAAAWRKKLRRGGLKLGPGVERA
jgi:hypothetical protein